MKTIRSLDELFVADIRRIYAGERRFMEVLPAWIEGASAFDLENLFADELKRTLVRSQRIEEIGSELEFTVDDGDNKVVEGVILKGERALHLTDNQDARDVALIATAQRFAHYQWAAYRAVAAFAKQLGYVYPMDLLQMSMTDVHDTRKQLSRLGEGGFLFSGLNEQAQI